MMRVRPIGYAKMSEVCPEFAMRVLDEKSPQYLLRMTDIEWPKHRERVHKQGIDTQFVKVGGQGVWVFKTRSGTTPGLMHTQQIKFINDWKYFKRPVRDEEEAIKLVNMMIKSDVLFFCSCASYKYWGWWYIQVKEHTNLYPLIAPGGGKPTRNNVSEKGKICKHGTSLFTLLPLALPQITRQLIRLGKIKIDPNAEKLDARKTREFM